MLSKEGMFIKLLCSVGSLLLLLTPLRAEHIVGGVITYNCLGNGDYEFVLRVYRDCNATQGAPLDDLANIGIYRCDIGGNCSNLDQDDFLARLAVPLSSSSFVEAPDFPCLIPPDVCVEEGIYRFRLSDYNVRLPAGDVSYHISYTRCCRNRTINNIVSPANVGSTYTIEITPEAQRLCNSSPTFDQFPPIVICNNQPLDFDHSATDSDGDQLVYEFCSPLDGGGPVTEDPVLSSCDGARPIPACPPPYGNIDFVSPTFTPTTPMAGDPVIRIDPNTGRITGTPRIQGQFVVGVCVKEYRDGELLSTVFRDFQFNVASCDPVVEAGIQSDRVIDEREFLVNSCGVNTITFQNQSRDRQFIDFFEWTFDINGELQTFDEWDPTVTFPGIGEYEGQLILNPETDCGDTANIFVNVFPAIDADFEFNYDTCVAEPVQFEDLSTTGSDGITDWRWSFGDGGSSQEQNPSFLYQTPGVKPATLTVTDVNECQDNITRPVRYFPVPGLIIISPSAEVACAPVPIFFNNLSTPIDSTYDIFWEFGDGGTGTAVSPTYVYENPGVYDVSVDITSPIGCQTDTLFEDLITVQESPVAGFSFTPEMPSNIEPQVTFTDNSERANRWLYDFGDGRNSFERNPIHTYADTGRFEVRQIVTHPNGCTDTALALIDLRPEVRYHLPNAFTPNSDSVNDEYRGAGLLVGATNFELTIWNRWGEMVFQTNNPDEGWNGRKFNSGQQSPNGVYAVLVTFRGPRGERFEFKTFATLIR